MPKISALPAATSVGAADLFAIVQSATTKKATASLVLAYVTANIVITDANFSGVLSLTHGGTNKALTASNGGIVYSDADSMEILPGTATANQALLSGASGPPGWSTATYPATVAISTVLYASAANVISGLPASNSSVFVSGATGVPAWKGPLTNGQLVIGSTGAVPNAATLTAGSGISITNGAGTITIANTGGGLTWSEVTGATQAISVNNGYIANRGGGVAFSLPATSAVGDVFAIVGKVGIWSITQGAGQQINIGATASTLGAGGSVTAAAATDSVQLVCTTANTIWTTVGGPQSAGLVVV